ncbi:MAG: 3-phosphoshikimate 1-carboxyvinyltransferase [Flavisolibacter sp.]
MTVTVIPSELHGSITAPASKSAMQRACAAALIRGGTTHLHNAGCSADDQAALSIIQALGATVSGEDDSVVIHSQGLRPLKNEIHAGESGLSVRMFTPIAACAEKQITITGSGSLSRRPLSFFNDVLPLLQVQVSSRDGLLPLQVQGPLHPQNITVDGSLSSQFLTGLLFAYAAANASDVSIHVRNLNSKPYIDLTLAIMKDFGLKTPVNDNYESFYFPAQSPVPFAGDSLQYTVEGDWSGGAFLLVAGALGGDIRVKGLDLFSTQADKAIWQVLKAAGVETRVEENEIFLNKQPAIQPFHFNATDCPDLFPPLVALASCATGESVIEGVERLTHKESNRSLTLQQEFGKMGVPVTIEGNQMKITGVEVLKAEEVHSHNDHRIAMACAVAALRADGAVSISNAESVNKSYPKFWQDMQSLGAALTFI